MSRERLLSDYVPWRDYGRSDVILTTGNSVIMMMEIDGLPSETNDDPFVNHNQEIRETSLRNNAQDGMTYHFLQCRGVADPAIYPAGKFRSEFAANLDRRYHDKLFGTRSMWLNRTYLASELAPRLIAGKAGKLLSFGRPTAEPAARAVNQLTRTVHVLAEELKAFNPRILSVVERDGRLFSEIAEATAFAMTGYWRPVPLTTSSASSVFSERFIIGWESFEVRMPHGSAFGFCLGMHDYPFQTVPGMFDRFLQADYRHTVFHAFRCLPSIDGQAMATRKQNKSRFAGDRAVDQANELAVAANLIAGNRLMIGEHASALTVFVDEPHEFGRVVQKAWGDMGCGGLKVERENVALEAVLFSMVPGCFHLRGRQAAISSRNFAAFASMHNYPMGRRKGRWGDPIAVFRTSGGTPYLFHLHVDGVGNSFISGMTGAGKSVLVGFIVCQAERTGAQIVLWDKDRGLEALVRHVGGSYLSLRNTPGLGAGLAPLKRLTGDPEDMAFLSGLIRACVSTPAPYEWEPEEERRLGIALRYVMSLPPEDRCLEEVRAFLGTDRSGAGARLEKWCAGGEFGWIIDCERDIVDLDNMVLGFDQSALIGDPIAAGAVMATLFHYTGKLVDGRRLLFVLDEVWKALEVRQFQAEIKNGLKTWRKYNSPIIMATQEVSDALNSPIGDTIKGQTPTQIFFSDPKAAWKYYGPDGMNLTETEFDIVRRLPKGTGTFLLRQGERSCVLQAPLSGLDEVAVISGSADGVKALALSLERAPGAVGEALMREYRKALSEVAE